MTVVDMAYPTIAVSLAKDMLAPVYSFFYSRRFNLSVEHEEDVMSLEWWGHDGSLCAITFEDGDVTVYKNKDGEIEIDEPCSLDYTLDDIQKAYPRLFI